MTDFVLGQHEADLKQIGLRVASIERKLDGVVLTLAERKGERKALAGLAAVVGGLMSLIVSIVVRLWHVH